MRYFLISDGKLISVAIDSVRKSSQRSHPEMFSGHKECENIKKLLSVMKGRLCSLLILHQPNIIAGIWYLFRTHLSYLLQKPVLSHFPRLLCTYAVF